MIVQRNTSTTDASYEVWVAGWGARNGPFDKINCIKAAREAAKNPMGLRDAKILVESGNSYLIATLATRDGADALCRELLRAGIKFLVKSVETLRVEQTDVPEFQVQPVTFLLTAAERERLESLRERWGFETLDSTLAYMIRNAD